MNKYKILCDHRSGRFYDRLDHISLQAQRYLEDEQKEGRQLQFAKIFLSDIVNQEAELRQSDLMTRIIGSCDHAVIQQPPLNGAKIALLLKTSDTENVFRLHSLRLTDDEVANLGAYVQTVMLFDKYLAILADAGLSLKEHCVRTWIYVRDIDTNYDGVVKARNDIFRQHGLTTGTHFIASTGIGGRASGRKVVVAIDFLTCATVKPSDLHYLKAPDHLNLTYEYGVAFERGVRITQPSRYQYFISGTASINNRGEVIHVGHVEHQAARLIENIEALLKDGGATLGDVKYFIAYLRDIADAPIIEAFLQQHYPTVPHVVTLAKVCRPAWLVEMECEAEREILKTNT